MSSAWDTAAMLPLSPPRDLNVPAPPGGFRWFQLVPPGGDGGDVMSAYYRVQDEMPPRYDVALETAYARAAVEEL